jgi:hypothetical protein
MKFALAALVVPAAVLSACTTVSDLNSDSVTCSASTTLAPTSATAAPTTAMSFADACTLVKTKYFAPVMVCMNAAGCNAICVTACQNGTVVSSLFAAGSVFNLDNTNTYLIHGGMFARGVRAGLTAMLAASLFSGGATGQCNYTNCAGVCASGSFASISAAAVVAVALAAASSAQ